MPAANPGLDCCHDTGGHSRDCDAIARAEKAEAEVARLRALIEEVEWSGDGGGGTGGEYMGSVCPWCQADPPFVAGAAGHRASCEAFPPGGAS